MPGRASAAQPEQGYYTGKAGERIEGFAAAAEVIYTCLMSEYLTKDPGENDRASRLKAIIDKLAAGASPQAVKKEFHDLIKGADAVEVAELEQSLIEGGLPVSEVQRLCEVHADVFKAGLERGEKPQRMPGHPVHTYLAENAEARKHTRALWLRFGGRQP